MILLHVSDLGCRNGVRIDTGYGMPDLVAYTGDAECVDVIEKLLSEYGDRLVYVSGEREVPAARRRLQEADVLVDGRVVERHGLRIAGVGGLGMREDMDHLGSSARADILLTHFPPHPGLDRDRLGLHRGLTILSILASRLRARTVLYGHAGIPGCRVIDGVLHSNASQGHANVIEWSSRGFECLDTQRLEP